MIICVYCCKLFCPWWCINAWVSTILFSYVILMGGFLEQVNYIILEEFPLISLFKTHIIQNELIFCWKTFTRWVFLLQVDEMEIKVNKEKENIKESLSRSPLWTFQLLSRLKMGNISQEPPGGEERVKSGIKRNWKTQLVKWDFSKTRTIM